MRTFLTYGFYLCGVLFLIYELLKVGGLNFLTIIKELTKKAEAEAIRNKEIEAGTVVGEQKASNAVAFALFTFALLGWLILYYIWALVGLFTSQWILFLVLLLVGTVAALLQKLYKTVSIKKEYSPLIYRLDSLVKVILLIFIIINRFHLGITF